MKCGRIDAGASSYLGRRVTHSVRCGADLVAAFEDTQAWASFKAMPLSTSCSTLVLPHSALSKVTLRAAPAMPRRLWAAPSTFRNELGMSNDRNTKQGCRVRSPSVTGQLALPVHCECPHTPPHPSETRWEHPFPYIVHQPRRPSFCGSANGSYLVFHLLGYLCHTPDPPRQLRERIRLSLRRCSTTQSGLALLETR